MILKGLHQPGYPLPPDFFAKFLCGMGLGGGLEDIGVICKAYSVKELAADKEL
jgi:hypothetical protein